MFLINSFEQRYNSRNKTNTMSIPLNLLLGQHKQNKIKPKSSKLTITSFNKPISKTNINEYIYFIIIIISIKLYIESIIFI